MMRPATSRTSSKRQQARSILLRPVAAALIAVGLASPALAVDTTWLGGAGDWSVGANWSAGQPAASDTAIINIGTVNLDFATTILGLNQAGGTIAGTGDLTLTGASSWTAGTVRDAAITTFNGPLALSGNDYKNIMYGRTIVSGNTTWTGNTAANSNSLYLNDGIFNNTGTFTDTNAFNNQMTGYNGTFNNIGTYNKQTNTTTAINTVFNNSGTLNVNAGTLRLQRNGTHTDSFAIASGATLNFIDGTHNLNAATIHGAGNLEISGGQVNLNGGSVTSTLLLSGGTLAGASTPIDANTTWTAGTVRDAATTTFNGSLTLSRNGNKGIMYGRTIVARNTSWTGNTSANTNTLQFNDGIFNNTGTFTDTNAFNNQMTGYNGTFNNIGTYNKQTTITTAINTVFNNSGTLNVNAGTMRLQRDGTHTGSFAIASGSTLNFIDGTHNLNAATIHGAGNLEISGGQVNLNGGSVTSTLLLSGGTLAGTSTPIDANTTWTAGTVRDTATTTFNGSLTLSGNASKGIMSGRTVVAGNTSWSDNTSANNNTLQFNSGTFNNTGTFTDTNAFNNQMTGGSSTFNNAGTYNKQTNITTAIGTAFKNSGTVNVNAGRMQVSTAFTNNGVINAAAGATFLGSHTTFVNAGTLTGNGMIATHANGDIVNQGAINPGNSIGHLTIDGKLQETATGALNLELASLASFDLLTVTGSATLAGEIDVWNAGYKPVIGDKFTVMTFDDRAGTTFDSLSIHGFGSGVAFDVIYNTNDVTLQVAAVPEPETWAMLLAGLGLVGLAGRRRRTPPA